MLLKLKKIKQEMSNITSFIFEKPKGFTFYAGQYLDIELPVNPERSRRVEDPLGKTRAFTISSSPTENFLMITPKKGISVFKKHLFKLKVGDTISASHPAGTFILDETEPAVFIAGGIGITPFRSMIKYALDQKLSTPITLIYSNSEKNFLFKKELDNWQKAYSKLKIIYVVTGHNRRLTHLPLFEPEPQSRRPTTPSTSLGTGYHLPIYYLAGPPKMVDDFAKMLKDLDVEEVNTRYDRFDGY